MVIALVFGYTENRILKVTMNLLKYNYANDMYQTQFSFSSLNGGSSFRNNGNPREKKLNVKVKVNLCLYWYHFFICGQFPSPLFINYEKVKKEKDTFIDLCIGTKNL